jgi:serine O-acetyltransferase
MRKAVISSALDLMRRDAARWVRPEQIADPREVTPAVFARLVFRNVPLRAMVWFRIGSAAKQLGIRGASGFVQRRLLLRYGLEIAPGSTVGGGLYVAHPIGCVLHAESIGENVSVISNVTFGTRGDGRWPTIGDRAFVGAGARIIGGIAIGADAAIGANAVVLHDVPEGATAIGIPARTRDTMT